MSDATKFEEQIRDEPFILFCENIIKNVGPASIEVLHAWFYNTYSTTKTKLKKDESESK
jgi:hypothetical protein